MSKTLVAYFSASGVTEAKAKKLAEALNSDVYAIKPVQPYTTADLDWRNKASRSSLEMSNKASRPEIIKGDVNISEYDTIVLGFPIWWYTAPTIMNTFLEAYDFTDKKIILFATSGGSAFGNTVKDLQVSAANATIVEATIMNGDVDVDAITKLI